MHQQAPNSACVPNNVHRQPFHTVSLICACTTKVALLTERTEKILVKCC